MIGRLTKDPEPRTTSNGVSVTTFTLAVDRRFGDNETDFIPIVTWRDWRTALSTWQLRLQRWRLQIPRYEDSNGKGYVTEVVADEVQFLRAGKTKCSQEAPSGFELVSDEELPF